MLDRGLDDLPAATNTCGQYFELLTVLAPRVDHSRVVDIMRKAGHLPLVRPYLNNVQNTNLQAVNEAINALCVEEEDHAALRTSIDTYDAFDQLALAQRCEKHELLEFRRIASYIYQKNKRWQQSVELSKRDASPETIRAQVMSAASPLRPSPRARSVTPTGAVAPTSAASVGADSSGASPLPSRPVLSVSALSQEALCTPPPRTLGARFGLGGAHDKGNVTGVSHLEAARALGDSDGWWPRY